METEELFSGSASHANAQSFEYALDGLEKYVKRKINQDKPYSYKQQTYEGGGDAD